MKNIIEGISADTVEAVKCSLEATIKLSGMGAGAAGIRDYDEPTQAAITALLASGEVYTKAQVDKILRGEYGDVYQESEVVLRKDYDVLVKQYQSLVAFYDKHVGTPCEQIRHQQELDSLQGILERARNTIFFYGEEVSPGLFGWQLDEIGKALSKFTTKQEAR